MREAVRPAQMKQQESRSEEDTISLLGEETDDTYANNELGEQ
jgi:hypothetical protein